MKNKGLTFIELIIAVFIIMIASSGAFAILHKILSSTSFYSSTIVASSLAQEGLEIVRNIRDTNWLQEENWATGLVSCSSPNFCETDYNANALTPVSELRFLTIDSQGFYSYGGEKETKFKRGIIINVSDEKMDIQVLVRWNEAGRDQEVSVQGQLWNWY